ncbi:MAG: amidohydrolase [candidate division WOR-3 bacterium]|nr:MAG: amidohydrolase [candidate division WOR-3 bacterium]
MIIDGHVHICEPPYTQEKACVNIVGGRPMAMPVKKADFTADILLRDMDKHRINKAVIMAFPGLLSNEFLSKVIKKHPERLFGFASVTNPKKADESIKTLTKAVKQLGLKGLKLHPDCHKFSPADPEIRPLMECAADLNIPVLIHSFAGGMIRGYFEHNVPKNIDTLKSRVPNVKVIIAHVAGPRFMDLLTIGQIPGVFVETSWGLTLLADLFGIDFVTQFIRNVGVDNFIFGSDWSGTPHPATKEQLELIQKLNLTEAEKKKILSENIAKVLRITA